MALTGEDQLKLNVMMAQDVQAVRIDENRLQVYGLTLDGEARIDLNPNSKPEQYTKLVREFLSGHVFGSPGGYPVFISRWTRMGQAKEENLQQLLMLGEPEAVMAVVHAQGLSPEVARCAWWCMPESENARCMLEKPVIAQSDLGSVLADHLFEHLAFETEPRPMIDSVRLMLQAGLISEEKKNKIWRSSQRKNTYLVGFLQAIPNELPHTKMARHDYDEISQLVTEADMQNNPYIQQLLWWLGESGQGYLDTVNTVLKKPANQDVVVYLLDTIREKLSDCLPVNLEQFPEEVAQIDERVEQLLQGDSETCRQADQEWQELVNQDTGCESDLQSLLWLSQLSEAIVNRIFSQTTAEGTLMRKKLKPVTDPVFSHINQLQGLT